MANVEIYLSDLCGFCWRARQLLDSKGVTYDAYDVDTNPALRSEMMERAGRRTVPQIFIAGEHIGGCDDLFALERADRLDGLLSGAAD